MTKTKQITNKTRIFNSIIKVKEEGEKKNVQVKDNLILQPNDVKQKLLDRIKRHRQHQKRVSMLKQLNR